jgi:flagellum-specific peptidoglycan hydrolase FlgJ
MRRQQQPERTKLYWVSRDGLFYYGPMYYAQIHAKTIEYIRREPIGTFRAIGDSIYTTSATYAEKMTEVIAQRIASAINGTVELI